MGNLIQGQGDENGISWFEQILSQMKNKSVTWYDVTWYNETLLYVKFGPRAQISIGTFGEFTTMTDMHKQTQKHPLLIFVIEKTFSVVPSLVLFVFDGME